LPGGTALAAHLHLARAISRRAEADMVALAAQEKITKPRCVTPNRLSDHLFRDGAPRPMTVAWRRALGSGENR